jgi:hypothetical protein
MHLGWVEREGKRRKEGMEDVDGPVNQLPTRAVQSGPIRMSVGAFFSGMIDRRGGHRTSVSSHRRDVFRRSPRVSSPPVR